ncbi:InlB B-repeat-containing protein [Anaerotalea alkaliphila]|uniref:LPXTG cell wall anchor domain-containing protein n=1 Tax=Anaerotalea alkaliphila TaxID=2662126 RepID=A0A7X5HUP1_9FIRM|nr:InlB B-repeat-containing protein [Anaerotalea alkaliphila]NDL66998.1 LPXTG cell wall anchor domain-containing protein [Anaerotalea alkaliphila]
MKKNLRKVLSLLLAVTLMVAASVVAMPEVQALSTYTSDSTILEWSGTSTNKHSTAGVAWVKGDKLYLAVVTTVHNINRVRNADGSEVGASVEYATTSESALKVNGVTVMTIDREDAHKDAAFAVLALDYEDILFPISFDILVGGGAQGAGGHNIYGVTIDGIHIVQYLADAGGAIQGNPVQYIWPGHDTTPVTAVADPGYFFQYWSPDDNPDATRSESNVAANATYTARFGSTPPPTTYPLTYEANGGTGTMTDPASPYGEGTDATVLENAFTAPEGYEFTGWTDSLVEGASYQPGDTITMNGPVTLYALWDEVEDNGGDPPPTTYPLTYEANGGTGTMTDPASPYGEGMDATVLENAFTAPEGYEFTGWTDSLVEGASYQPGDTITMNGPVTLYALWGEVEDNGGDPELATFTLAYDANGGTGTMTDPASPYGEEGSAIVLANTFARSGYSFVGWNTAANGSGVSFNPGDSISMTADIVLYAQWSADRTGSSTSKITTPSTEPEVELPETTIPESPVAVEEPAPEPEPETEETVIEEQPLPEAVEEPELELTVALEQEELPQAGGTPVGLFLGLGTAFLGSGLVLRRKRH